MNLLSVEGVTVRYGGSILALEDVTLSTDGAEAIAILGANGAGKTSLLRAIGGLLPFHRGAVTAGRVCFDGREVRGKDPASLVAAGMAQTLEGRRMFGQLSVAANLRLGAFPAHARPRHDQTRSELLELFPRLGERLEQPAGTLSGGEQQMVAIARALMSCPRLLMLDEPSLGLAPRVVAEIGIALRAISERGTAIVLVDQNTALALQVTKRAYLLETGRVAASGPTASLLMDDGVRASYLGTTAGSLPMEARP